MHYLAAADTDVGIVKKVNQDSVLVKHARYAGGEVLMAVICDGMGGLEKGELASATVIRRFRKWFDEELPQKLAGADMDAIAGEWTDLLKDLNDRIGAYGQKCGTRLGTTFTGILFLGNQYAAVHVGDTRLYRIGDSVTQMTKDQTFIAREIERGTMTPEQARTDKRRNMLLQCVGASETIEPQTLTGEVREGAYLLCSDGFRHEVTAEEILKEFQGKDLRDKKTMQTHIRNLIETVKARREKDNISAILVKAG